MNISTVDAFVIRVSIIHAWKIVTTECFQNKRYSIFVEKYVRPTYLFSTYHNNNWNTSWDIRWFNIEINIIVSESWIWVQVWHSLHKIVEEAACLRLITDDRYKLEQVFNINEMPILDNSASDFKAANNRLT